VMGADRSPEEDRDGEKVADETQLRWTLKSCSPDWVSTGLRSEQSEDM